MVVRPFSGVGIRVCISCDDLDSCALASSEAFDTDEVLVGHFCGSCVDGSQCALLGCGLFCSGTLEVAFENS